MAITQIEPYYDVGTATFTASTAVTGQGTSWLTNVMPGDQIFNRLGQMAVVATVNSDTSITLTKAFAGTVQTAQAYTIYRVPDSVRLENFSQRSVNLLKGGNVRALADLALGANNLIKATGAGTLETFDGANLISEAAIDGTGGNWLSYYTGDGAKARTPFTAFARTMLGDASGNSMLATLGVTTFMRSMLDDADAAAAMTTLGVSPFARTLLDDADAATARGTLGSNDAANLTTGLLDVARVPATLTPDKAFRRGNVLGTVSQSGGVPTGALVEQGSNTNGSFEKYANGRLICRSVRGPYDINTPAPSGGQSTPYLFWTFPHLFVGGLPCVVCNDSNSSNVQGFAGSGLNGSEFTLRYHQVLLARTAVLEATGRWF